MSSPTYLVPKQVGDLLARLPAYPGSLLFVAGLNLALTQHLASDVTAMLVGYLSGYLFPNTFSGVYNSPLEMYGFCIIFAIGVSYIAYRGVNGSTAVNIAINVIQITALVVRSPRSVPHCGSVRFIVPPHWPDASLGR